MKNHSQAPDFFRHPDQMLKAIPLAPKASKALDYLIHNYLDYYHLNFSTDASAQGHEIWQSDINHCRIVEQRWLACAPRGETLLIVHGYFDHSGLYGKLIKWGLQQGFDVHCFDLPGHGLSGGQPAAIDNFDRYSEVLSSIINREAYAKHHLVGQSTGGAVIINYLLNPNLHPKLTVKPQEVVLLAPLVRSMHWQRMRWLYFVLHHVLHSIKRSFARSSHDDDFLLFLKDRDPLQSKRIPLIWLGAMDDWVHKLKQLPIRTDLKPLVIQGTKDSTVDWRYNLSEIQHCLPKSDIKLIEGAMHHMVNESDPYWMAIVKSMEKHFGFCN